MRQTHSFYQFTFFHFQRRIKSFPFIITEQLNSHWNSHVLYQKQSTSWSTNFKNFSFFQFPKLSQEPNRKLPKQAKTHLRIGLHQQTRNVVPVPGIEPSIQLDSASLPPMPSGKIIHLVQPKTKREKERERENLTSESASGYHAMAQEEPHIDPWTGSETES